MVKLFTSSIFWWTSSLKSSSSGALVDKLENVSKYLLTSEVLTENDPLRWSSSPWLTISSSNVQSDLSSVDSFRKSEKYHYQAPLKPEQSKLMWYVLLIVPLCTLGAKAKIWNVFQCSLYNLFVHEFSEKVFHFWIF